MNPLITYLQIVALRAKAKVQAFATQEPVRLRAALTSLVLAAAVVFPSVNADVAETVGAVGVVALPILVGESARSKVTPTK
ncbi:hypothetical protein AQJ23_44835 [Streptomyces antibioticus]|nr:hypothetical protein [Streptomyces antibioticus]KUN16523.1 hypothetical protein AQJ23_44835 [Streptomyces antibioticus]